MKLTWTIFLKDLSRVWAPWLLWLAMAIADIGLGSRLLHGGEVNQGTQIETEEYRSLIHGLFVILGYILAAWLVQLDSPVNAESEWMNRPISGMRLFAAKVLGVLLLMVAPMLLIDAVWWNACGLLTLQLPGAALETLTLCASMALTSVFLSSLSRDWPRFLILTMAVLGFCVLAETSGMPLLGVLVADARMEENHRILRTELIWIVLAGFFVATLVQYSSRRLGRSSGVACIGVLVAMLVSQRIESQVAYGQWPADQPAVAPSAPEPLPEGIHLRYGDAHLFDDPMHPKTFFKKRNEFLMMHWPLALNIHLDGTRPGEMFRGLVFAGSLGISGRELPSRTWMAENATEHFVDYIPRGMLGTTPGDVVFGMRFALPRSIAAKALEGPATLRGTMFLQRLVTKVGTKLPLREGASGRFWGTTLSVVRTKVFAADSDSGPGHPWRIETIVNVVGPSDIKWSDHYSDGDIGGYVFWHPSTGEAIYATEGNLALAYVHGVRLERGLFSGYVPFGPSADTPEKAQEWLDGAQLVWVGYAPAEYYRVPIDVPDLKVSIGRG